MGFDLYGKKPTAPSGTYFRRNIWTWPPLADLCLKLAPQEASRCEAWYTNEGSGLDAEDAIRLAEKLEQLIADGAVADYISSYRYGESPEEKRVLALGEAVKHFVGKVFGEGVVIVDSPIEEGSEVCLGEEDVREFMAFVRASGGFEIW